MRLAFRSSKQAWAGIVFMAIGAFALTASHQYELGSATHMGPGYFPSMLALLLMVVGLAALVQAVARADGEPVGPVDVLPVLFLVAGVAAFGLLIERTGLASALFALIVLSCYKRLRARPLEVLAIFLVVAVLTAGIFITLIKLPIQLF